MADFMTELWSSIFNPGTNPTLLIATNVTFAALQLVLAALLAATYSIHFLILSILCGGLWWSINWFVQELKAAQAKEEEAERLRRKKKGDSDWRSRGEVDDSADDEGEDTEVEDAKSGGLRESTSSLEPSDGHEIGDRSATIGDSGIGATSGAGLFSGSQYSPRSSSLRHRLVDEGDKSGEISTDSEWEKVPAHSDR